MNESVNDNLKRIIAGELQLVEAYLADALHTGSEDFNSLIRPLALSGGKRLRAQLCLLIALAGHSNQDQRVAVAAAVEMLHLATLIHDDVLDQAAMRRGHEAIHCSKGNKVAILSGDYLFAKAFDVVAQIGSVECLKIFSFVISALVEGEFLQMEDVFRVDQGVERYLIKTQKKTADFIEACLELGGILGHWNSEDIVLLKRFGHALGMSFQITDDILDYQATEATAGKPVGKDLREGILTYPLLAIVREDNKAYIESELRRIETGGDVMEFMSYIAKEGGVTEAEKLNATYVKEAQDALTALPAFAGKEILLGVLMSLAHRKV